MGTVITDQDFTALLRWVQRECDISRALLADKLGYSEFVLRQQLNYDRLVNAPTVRSSDP